MIAIGIANDHSGCHLKVQLMSFLKNQLKYKKILNFGTNTEKVVDYPDYAHHVTNAIGDKKVDLGILICGSGIGMSICANRDKYVRAALCNDVKVAQLSRNHNDANILCLGARIIDEDVAVNCCRSFFSSEFKAGRHLSRINKI